ncbi:hypothetical protein CC80DRAFT_556030 [Byssothecium circinans]|uniref:Uncharacterized protein n=1 Tax=Byssothecium circinans TaxID=147558 RepID=A0A6A5TDD8_9PLEO|nr:hypothetical protein CC80DRAFT_556030 [Byssothecium circinans]
MKLSCLLPKATLILHTASSQPTPVISSADTADIASTLLLFYRSLDLKSDPLLRTITTTNFTFDGTAFSSIGIGAPVPLVGQDVIIPGLLEGFKNLTTMHNVGNFNVTAYNGNKKGDRHAEEERANATAYVLAYHYKALEVPRESPRNNYLMGTLFLGDLVKKGEKGKWKFERVELKPFFQSGNSDVMGLGQ